MWLPYCKQRLSIDRKLLITSGFVRIFLVLVFLFFLWVAIIWSSWFP